MKATWAVAAGVLLALAACRKPAAPMMFERPPAPVTVVAAAAEDAPRYIDEIGRAVASEAVTIRSQVAGRITALHFEDGADVKRNDLLFSIDPRPFQAQVAAAEAAAAQSAAALALAKTEYERLAKLVDSRAVSKQELDAKKSAVDVAEARLRQHHAGVDTARLDLEYCTIRSPIDGRTGRRLVDPGNLVEANGAELLVVQKLDPIYADFAIPEQRLAELRRSLAEHPLAVEVRIPDDAQPARAGELTFVDSGVQDATGTVGLRATAPNGDRHFWPGQFLRVRIILETIKGAVLIPMSATQISAQGPFVYVIKDDSSAELRPVTLGQRHGDRVVIEKGLAAGERVVLEGHLGVMPGGKVKVADAGAVPGGNHKP